MARVPRVLVGIVTYEGKDYIWDEFFKNLTSLSYPAYDILIVDNTRDKKYYSKLVRRTKGYKNVTIKHVNRGDTTREAQAKCLNVIRKKVLDEGYDYFMSIESDLIPPKDIIERLMSHRRTIVGSLYTIGIADHPTQPPRFCLFRTQGKSTVNIPPPESWEYYGRGLVRIHGCGLGSTLIHRSVLEKIKFWYILDSKKDLHHFGGDIINIHPYMTEGVPKHSDVLMYMDLENLGVEVWCDSDIVIPHHNSDWSKVADI